MDALTRGYREQALKARARSIRDLIKLWALLDFTDLDESFAPWTVPVATLVQRDREVVAGAAATYMRAERKVQGVSGAPVIELAGPVATARMAASLTSTTLAGYRTALRYYPAAKAQEVAFVKTAGAVGRMVLGGGRDTILESVRRDPVGRGWARVTGPKACDWCLMLAGRGAVYDAGSVNFSAHDHCACTARPVYVGDAPILTREPRPTSLQAA